MELISQHSGVSWVKETCEADAIIITSQCEPTTWILWSWSCDVTSQSQLSIWMLLSKASQCWLNMGILPHSPYAISPTKPTVVSVDCDKFSLFWWSPLSDHESHYALRSPRILVSSQYLEHIKTLPFFKCLTTGNVCQHAGSRRKSE